MIAQAGILVFLLPIGLLLVALASAPRESETRAGAAGLVAIAVSSLVFVAFGFALMFGGFGALSGRTEFAELTGYYAIPSSNGAFALAGLKGLFLEGVTGGFALFLAFLPMAQACAVLVMATLWQRASLAVIAVAAALCTLAYSFLGMAVWGGGFGLTLASAFRLGHGPVDLGGLGLAGLIAGAFSLVSSDRLRVTGPVTLAHSPHPLRAAAGAALAIIGAIGFVASNPIVATGSPAQGALAAVLFTSAGVAGVVSLAYSVFVSGKPALDVAAGAVVGSLIAVSPGAMTLPVWAAAGLGLVAAISVIVGGYAWRRMAGGRPGGQGVPGFLVPAVIGFLAVGFVANGRFGAGLNGVGADSYLGARDVGIIGILGGPNGLSDPGQLTAQCVIALLATGVACLAGFPMRLMTREYARAEANPIAIAVSPPIQDQPARVMELAPDTVIDSSTIGLADSAPVALHPEPADEPPASVSVGPSERVRSELSGLTPPKGEVPPSVTAKPGPSAAPSSPSLLERLRRGRSAPPQPAGQARRVAYPVRVGGRRIILRAIPPETPPSETAEPPAP